VLVVLHIAPSSPSALPAILRRTSRLPAEHAFDGARLEPGRVYVAPPDRHMVVRDGYVTLPRGPKENGHRPAVDPLFRSAARWYGPAVIGVVLSGTLDDGAAGLAAIKARGGRALVQDPDDALYDGMPLAALRAVVPDAVVPLAEMAALLVAWANEDPPSAGPVDEELQIETDVAELEETAHAEQDRPGSPAGFSCPDCGGAMFEIDSDTLRFRCRVGHAWSPASLMVEQVEGAEAALWTAIRHLEERAALHRRLASEAKARNHERATNIQEERAQESTRSAGVLRQLIRDSFVENPEASVD
jgi:two-component system chemotaxis response regulator CheB